MFLTTSIQAEASKEEPLSV